MSAPRFNTRQFVSPLTPLAKIDPTGFDVLREPLVEGVFAHLFKAGPVAHAMLEEIAKHSERDPRFATLTVRRHVKYRHWHTDFQTSRHPVRNYLLVTGEPCTVFLQESAPEIPLGLESDENDARLDQFVRARIADGKLHEVAIDPWTLVAYDHCELHRGGLRVNTEPRLFVRVTIIDHPAPWLR